MRIICKIDLRHWTILVAIGRPTQIIVIISKSNYCTAPSSLQQTGPSRFFVSFVMFVDVCAVQILKLVPGWAGYWYLFVWFVFRVFGFITEYWTLLFVCFEFANIAAAWNIGLCCRLGRMLLISWTANCHCPLCNGPAQPDYQDHLYRSSSKVLLSILCTEYRTSLQGEQDAAH